MPMISPVEVEVAPASATRAPRPQQMERPEGAPLPPQPPRSGRGFCGGLCDDSPEQTTRYKGRNERVFYDSARTKRSCIGRIHYGVACPGWSKATSERVVYSRWNLIPLSKLPAHFATQCCGCCCCVPSKDDWLPPPPQTNTFATPDPTGDADSDCCSFRLPCGRTLDTFDADIIVDASAHQTLLQICRGEGDVVLYRKAGADMSDPSEIFVMTDVVKPFNVFSDITFELSKINLQGATTQALGSRMGATVWSFDARAGTDNAPQSAFKGWRGEQEHVFFDSIEAPRTCCGAMLNHDICCPPVYKVTSERVLFTDWDWWHPCDSDWPTPLFCPCLSVFYCTRALARDFCCAIGAGAAAEERLKAASTAAQEQKKAREAERGPCGRCFKFPVGRTAHFFDIDLVADVRAEQACWQLCLNEGNLHFGRMQGGDASHDGASQAFFNMRNVPEVFSLFDDFSWELSKLDLSNFRQNAMRNDILRSG